MREGTGKCSVSIAEPACGRVAGVHAIGYEVQRLCRDADAALYRTRRSGRNRLIVDSENDDDLVEA